MSIQLTIHADSSLILELPDYLNDLMKKGVSISVMPDHLYNYISVKNITRRHDDEYEIQEVNKCFLIYRGLNRLYTVRFEL